MYYIKTDFKWSFGKFLAAFFSMATILALGFMGAMVQSNSIGESCLTAFNIPTWITGLIVSLLAVFIFIGGVQRIGSVTEKLVPVIAALYFVGRLIVLVVRIKYMPETIGMIFKYAFVPNTIVGGGIGFISVAFIFLGSVLSNELVWELTQAVPIFKNNQQCRKENNSG